MATVTFKAGRIWRSGKGGQHGQVFDGGSLRDLTDLTSSASAANVQEGGADYEAESDEIVRIGTSADVEVSVGDLGNWFTVSASADLDVGVYAGQKIQVRDP